MIRRVFGVFATRAVGAPRSTARQARGASDAMRATTIAGAVLLATGLAAAPAIAAPSVTLDRACYAAGDPITETATGFTPDSQVLETLGLISTTNPHSILNSLTAPLVSTDSSGAFTRQIRAPEVQLDGDRRELAVSSFTDQAAPEDPFFLQWTLSGWDIDAREWRDATGRAGEHVHIATWGWTSDGTTLYAHFFRGGGERRTARVGTLTGPCGDLKTTIAKTPFRRSTRATWKVYFSTTKALNRIDDAWISLKVAVGNPPRAGAARRTLAVVRHAARG